MPSQDILVVSGTQKRLVGGLERERKKKWSTGGYGSPYAASSDARTLVLSSPMACEKGVGLNVSSEVSSTTLKAAKRRNSRPTKFWLSAENHRKHTAQVAGIAWG